MLPVMSTATCGSDLSLDDGTIQEWKQDKH